MLVIRQEQMRVMGLAFEDGFSDKLAAQLRADYPQQVAGLDQRQLLAAVDAARHRAGFYGFEWQSSVLAFVTLSVTVGPYFDRQLRIAQLLNQRHVPADSRIAYLAEAISAAEWEEARGMAAA
ncbi:hypothetical protein HSX11_08570 [Oxalobacteraceae bacterium]|nr:hypothetical protein [Oxalobacteraceae bacterium]